MPGLLDHLRDLAGLRVLGLMTMAAWDAEEGAQRATFARLRTLRDRMATEGHHLPELSMGMSGDYPAAVEEGATCIRLGSVLFGDRST